ncbi:hypothetical protein [Nannocystis pusilla]|uniref:Uncharacterized protein n=1 Tax=Nannocystis pusilla TaxID=889268 RepID=A0ABS7TWU2_9BACT|nr:hypothetical protein [Nannocystis pusilla]MBZ5712501.1 hypothetical protein [Nannocystis pusilla]
MHYYIRLNFVLLGALAAACGEKGVDTDGTVTDTTSPDPPGTDGGPTTGTTTDTDGTTAPTTGESACVDPSVTDIGPAVDVTLRNNGATRLFINLDLNCSPILPFGLRDANDVAVRIDKDVCENSCDEILSGGCGCPSGCGPSDVLQLEPGGTFASKWSGRVWTDVTLPAECPEGGCAPECAAATQAPAGTYTVVARAHDAVVDCEPCTCVPGPEGSCVIDGGTAMGNEVVGEQALAYPMQTGLEVVFE